MEDGVVPAVSPSSGRGGDGGGGGGGGEGSGEIFSADDALQGVPPEENAPIETLMKFRLAITLKGEAEAQGPIYQLVPATIPKDNQLQFEWVIRMDRGIEDPVALSRRNALGTPNTRCEENKSTTVSGHKQWRFLGPVLAVTAFFSTLALGITIAVLS